MMRARADYGERVPQARRIPQWRAAWLGSVLLWLGGASSLADSVPSAEQVLQDFESVLRANPLPALKAVLPRYEPAQIELPGLIVGYFETDSDDGLRWGAAFGEVVRHMVARSPGFLANEPGFGWSSIWQDSQHPDVPLGDIFRSPRSLQVLGQRHGIRQAVSGRVTRRGDEFQVDVVWLDLTSLAAIRRTRHAVPSQELAALTAKVAGGILADLGFASERWDRRYLEAQAPASFEVFRAFASAMTRWESGDTAAAQRQLESIIDAGHPFQATVIDFLQLLRAESNQSAHNRLIRAIAARHRVDGGIQRAALNQIWVGDDAVLVAERLDWAKRIVSEHPDDLGALIVLALYLRDANRAADALRVSLEVLRRWPNNFHSWWLAGQMAERYAWSIRGAGWAQETPEDDLEFFARLLAVADRCVDRALAMHPHNPEIWRLAMNTRVADPERVYAAFERAAAMLPRDPYVYRTGLHFSGPKWGGPVELQMKVIERAVRNNPGQDWPYWYYWEMVEGDYTPRYWIPGLLHSLGCKYQCRQDLRTWAPWALLGLAALALVAVRMRRSRVR